MGPPRREIGVDIAEMVSADLETPIETLPTLAESIDLDALENIVSADSSADVTVTFTYADRHVLVRSGGRSVYGGSTAIAVSRSPSPIPTSEGANVRHPASLDGLAVPNGTRCRWVRTGSRGHRRRLRRQR